MKLDENTIARVVGCSSDFEVGSLGDIIVEGFPGLTQLKAGASDPDSRARRGELIEAVRGGKHVELAVTAQTFRQRSGKKNRRYLRLGDVTSSRVGTFKGQPFLVDHNTSEQSARKGTLFSSKLVEEGASQVFEMGFHAVKPDAVVSILDGTLDRFSIGWFSLGAVMCTLHGVDVRSSDGCGCWPGESVSVDGKAQIVEYEFSDWEGKELSGVNIPAVKQTSIDDVRAALAAELHLPTRIKEKNKMALIRLAALMGLSSLTDGDEDRAIAYMEAQQRQRVAAEQARDVAQAALVANSQALELATAAGAKVRVDALIEGAYRDGKLRYGRDEDGLAAPSKREDRLRRIAKADGVDALRAEIGEMEVVVPVGQRLATDTVRENRGDDVGGEPALTISPELDEVIRQLGLKDEEVLEFLASRRAH